MFRKIILPLPCISEIAISEMAIANLLWSVHARYVSSEAAILGDKAIRRLGDGLKAGDRLFFLGGAPDISLYEGFLCDNLLLIF